MVRSSVFILGGIVDWCENLIHRDSQRDPVIHGAHGRGRFVYRVTYAYERTQRLKQRLSGSDHSIVTAL